MNDEQVKSLEQFCDTYVKSFACWDLIIFFFDNQNGIEADDEMLSNCIGRSLEETSCYAKSLIDSGLLTVENNRYKLNSDIGIRTQVENFVRAVDDRSLRLALLTNLLKKGIR